MFSPFPSATFLVLFLHSYRLFFWSLGVYSMAKSKKKSPVLRFAQHDYDFCLLHPSSSNAQRFPCEQHSSGHSWTPSPLSVPPRTTITLADVVNSNRETRVRTKHRKRDMQRTPPAAPPQPSPRPCEHTSTSPISIRPRRGPLAKTGSLN